MSFRKMLFAAMKPLLKLVVFLSLLNIYIPFYALLSVIVFSKIAVYKLQLRLGYGSAEVPTIGLFSRIHRVPDVLTVSTKDKLDFLLNRGMAYVHRMAWWTPFEVVKLIFREQTVEKLTDQQLVYTLLTTVYAHSIKWNDAHDRLILDLSDFDNVVTFQGWFWEAREVRFKEDASEVAIRMSSGKVFYSTVQDVEGKENYRLAKLHLQACLSYFVPALSHNHVHFVYPGAMSFAVKCGLHKYRDSVLTKLLLPHLRFTDSINFQALYIGQSINNWKTLLDRYFFFWRTFPVTADEFREGIAKHCRLYYFGKPVPDPPSNQEINQRIKNIFPPEYVTDSWLQKIPYYYFLRRYYLVIEEFVQKIEPLIDRNEWDEVAKRVAQYLPGFDRVDMVTGLTTLIHQGAVVHSSDHDGYFRFACKYGCMAIRHPFEPYSNVAEHSAVAKEIGHSLEEVKLNPTLLLDQMQIMKTRVFLNLFVTYIFSHGCEQRLGKVSYDFEEAAAHKAAVEFVKKVQVLDRSLQKEKALIRLKGTKGTESRGNQLVPLDRMVCSVSF